MTFSIVVCIKQVPDTNDIRWTENNTIQRDGLDSIINPYDIGAIQFALDIKKILKDTKIFAVTMGPEQAKDILKEALAMGCDFGCLLSDKKFSGADTLATAYTLSQFIKTKIPDFKLVICGQQAVDGDTAQTPSSMAEKLDLPQITNVVALKTITDNSSVWIRETDRLKQEIEIIHPALIASSNPDVEIIPDIAGYISAQNKDIEVYDSASFDCDVERIGLKGSPTQVKRAFRYLISRDSKLIDKSTPESAADLIKHEIEQIRNI